MISTNDIIKAVNRELYAVKPTFTFYTDFFPQEFSRPAVRIELVRVSPARLLNKNIFQKTVYLTVTYYGPANEYYKADKTGLYDVADEFINIFAAGKLNVGGRYLNIAASTGGENDDEIFIDLQLEYTEAANEAAGEYEKMAVLNLKLKGDS